jgi:hypothetical protein
MQACTQLSVTCNLPKASIRTCWGCCWPSEAPIPQTMHAWIIIGWVIVLTARRNAVVFCRCFSLASPWLPQRNLASTHPTCLSTMAFTSRQLLARASSCAITASSLLLLGRGAPWCATATPGLHDCSRRNVHNTASSMQSLHQRYWTLTGLQDPRRLCGAMADRPRDASAW